MGDSDTSVPSNTSPPSTTTNEYGSVSTKLDEIILPVETPKTPASELSSWSDLTVVPILGAACFAHWRYRRLVPRRLPSLTPLRLAELYGTAGCAWVAFQEDLRLKGMVKRDRDLLTIEACAWLMRKSYHKFKSEKEPTALPDDLNNNVPRTGGRDFADIPLNWFCSHIWSGPIEWNIALSLVFPHIGNYQKELTMHDVDICITHMANTMSNPGSSGIFMHCALPFALAFCGVTPLAMLSRWARFSMTSRMLNGIQRALFYTTAAVAAAQEYQHWYYLFYLQDKECVARMLNATTGSQMQKNVDDFIRDREKDT